MRRRELWLVSMHEGSQNVQCTKVHKINGCPKCSKLMDVLNVHGHPEPGLSLLQLCCMRRRELWLVSMYEGSQN